MNEIEPLEEIQEIEPLEEIEPVDSECTIIDVSHSESTSKYENQQKMPDSGESSSEWEISDDDITDRNAFDMLTNNRAELWYYL